MDFLAILGCDTRLYHSQGGAMELALVAWRSNVGNTFRLNLLSWSSERTLKASSFERFVCQLVTTAKFILSFSKTSNIDIPLLKIDCCFCC